MAAATAARKIFRVVSRRVAGHDRTRALSVEHGSTNLTDAGCARGRKLGCVDGGAPSVPKIGKPDSIPGTSRAWCPEIPDGRGKVVACPYCYTGWAGSWAVSADWS